MEKSKVYFTKEITPESVVKMYEALGTNLTGKVAAKLHSGEQGNQNYIRPEFVKAIVEKVNGTVVECNTAYGGARNTTEKHEKLMKEHGWTKYFNVDIMDADGDDLELDIPNGKVIKKNYVGKHIHSAGVTKDPEKLWDNLPEQDKFLEAMTDAASSVHNLFKGKIVYINVMCNMSVDCDCCAVAEDPCMKDVGILASTDPIAIDQACIDIVYNSKDPGRDHLVERIERQHGVHTIEAASELGFGSREYELINVD